MIFKTNFPLILEVAKHMNCFMLFKDVLFQDSFLYCSEHYFILINNQFSFSNPLHVLYANFNRQDCSMDLVVFCCFAIYDLIAQELISLFLWFESNNLVLALTLSCCRYHQTVLLCRLRASFPCNFYFFEISFIYFF